MLQVDAIWVTQLVPTGTYHRDAKGRRRPDKKRIKRPIFIALGVWPDSDRAEVLAWHLADREDEGAWLAFLSDLEAAGICGANGLELIIHDGGAGLCAAFNRVHFGAAEQRCLFHKLRNLYHAIRVSGENLTRQEQRRQRKAIFRDFHHIWQAKRLATVLQRYRHVVRHYRLTQPEAVHCLRTDFRDRRLLCRAPTSSRLGHHSPPHHQPLGTLQPLPPAARPGRLRLSFRCRPTGHAHPGSGRFQLASNPMSEFQPNKIHYLTDQIRRFPYVRSEARITVQTVS